MFHADVVLVLLVLACLGMMGVALACEDRAETEARVGEERTAPAVARHRAPSPRRRDETPSTQNVLRM